MVLLDRWFIKQREELSFNLLPGRNCGNAMQQRFITSRANTILHDINNRRTTRTLGMVSKRSMHQTRMMKSRFAFL